MRAIPCYRPSQAELDDAPRPIKENMFFGNFEAAEDMDSYLSKQASKLKECKDCWSMLRKGVVTRQDAALVRTEDPFLDGDVEDGNDESETSESIVGKYSWRLLEWFVLLFEKDQGRTAEGALSIVNSFRGPFDNVDRRLFCLAFIADQTLPKKRRSPSLCGLDSGRDTSMLQSDRAMA